MPFKSKAQQRFMYAQHPRMAKRWADETKDIKGLPEKLHPGENIPKREYKKKKGMAKKADGMFFEKRSQAQSGHFFRDRVKSSDGQFLKAAFSAYMPGEIPRGGGINVSPSGMYGTGSGDEPSSQDKGPSEDSPKGGVGFRGEGKSGGMYGTGEPPSDATKKRDAESARLAELLAKASEGKERKASDSEEKEKEDKKEEASEEKTASLNPNDWDMGTDIPTGFHRPTSTQPEALETGGERFHSTTAKSPSHGVIEGGKLSLPKGAGSQMGKHASVSRFMGTSFALEKQAENPYEKDMGNYAKERFGEAKQSLRRAGHFVAQNADKGVKEITRNPAATALAALLIGHAGYGALKSVGRSALRGVTHGAKPPPSLLHQAGGTLKRIITGR